MGWEQLEMSDDDVMQLKRRMQSQMMDEAVLIHDLLVNDPRGVKLLDILDGMSIRQDDLVPGANERADQYAVRAAFRAGQCSFVQMIHTAIGMAEAGDNDE